MKRIVLIALVVLMSFGGYAQMVNKTKKVIVVKRPTATAPKSSVVDFSSDMSNVNVVYGRITENGDTLLIVNLPEVDINLMQRYLQITDMYYSK